MGTTRKRSYSPPRDLTVARCLLKYLYLEHAGGGRGGDDRCVLFGVPGAAVMYVLDELRRQEDRFRYVVCRQETGAAYMADGYARVTGKPGVVLVTSGPGATNALTGAVTAQGSNSSVLVVSGEVPEEDFGKGYLQEGIDSELNVNAVYRNACQYSAVITSPKDFQTLFEQALRTVMSRPRRTAHVSLPLDVSNERIDKARVPLTPENYRATPRCSAPEQTAEVLDHLLAAERPLLFLGAGCREALTDPDRRDRFRQFVEKFALPVMTSPGAKGLFPETHDLSLRTYGLAGCRWPTYYLDPKVSGGCDCLAVVASSLGDLATGRWDPALEPAGPFIQVDLDQGVVGRAFPITLGVVAEAGHFLDDLLDVAEQTDPDEESVAARRELVEEIKKRPAYHDPAKRDDTKSVPVLPQALMKCLGETLPAGSHVFIDAGNCVGWALHYLEVDPPTQVHSALAMGPMGFGVGAVVGGKLGAPESACVGIVGDGAFLMHAGEVSTAARNRVGAVWVVLHDDDLAMVSQGMNYYFPRPGWEKYYQIGEPALAKLARSLGADAYEVRSLKDFREDFARALRRAEAKQQPQVVVVRHDPDEIPPYYPAKKKPATSPARRAR